MSWLQCKYVQGAQQIKEFLAFVKTMYSELPNHLPKIFEPKQSLRVTDLAELDLDRLLTGTFAITPIQTEKKQADESPVTVSSNVSYACLLHVTCNFMYAYCSAVQHILPPFMYTYCSAVQHILPLFMYTYCSAEHSTSFRHWWYRHLYLIFLV
jgi:hypothetical protein